MADLRQNPGKNIVDFQKVLVVRSSTAHGMILELVETALGDNKIDHVIDENATFNSGRGFDTDVSCPSCNEVQALQIENAELKAGSAFKGFLTMGTMDSI